MKINIYLWALVLFIGVFLIGCNSQKLDTKSQRSLKGTWTLNSIDYQKLQENTVNSKLFNLADKSCFANSIWSFVPNNNTGQINWSSDQGCNEGHIDIIWIIIPEDGNNYLEFKKIPNGVKPKDVKEGYKLLYQPISDTEFNMVETVPFEDQTATLIYRFTKTK